MGTLSQVHGAQGGARKLSGADAFNTISSNNGMHRAGPGPHGRLKMSRLIDGAGWVSTEPCM